MSTNYYAKVRDAPALEPRHIGKFSGGWEFLWRAHKDLQLESTEQWKFLDHPWVVIEDEHGTVVPLGAFWQLANTISGCDRDPHGGSSGVVSIDDHFRQRQWRDSAGRPFADYEFC
jgi:hypothetical protein